MKGGKERKRRITIGAEARRERGEAGGSKARRVTAVADAMGGEEGGAFLLLPTVARARARWDGRDAQAVACSRGSRH